MQITWSLILANGHGKRFQLHPDAGLASEVNNIIKLEIGQAGSERKD